MAYLCQQQAGAPQRAADRTGVITMRTLQPAVGLAAAGMLMLTTSLPAQPFDVLFRVTHVKGVCQVRKPDASAFEPVVNGKAYPFGTVVRTGKDGEASLALSAEDILRAAPLTEVCVTEPAGSSPCSNRVVRLAQGRLDVAVHEGLAEKALTIETEVASCDALSGRSSVEMNRTAKPSRERLDLRLLVRTDSGNLRVSGPQFQVPKMKAGSAVRIESSADRSVTRIVNEANDFKVDIDNGTDTPVSLETSPRGAVRICRQHAPVGGKLVVSVLETASDGKGKGNFAFVLGEPLLVTAGALPSPAADEHSATGGVSAASAPATNAVPKKSEDLF